MEKNESVLTRHQVKTFSKEYTENGTTCKIIAEARYDDKCGNGHNSFGITASIYDRNRNNGDSSIMLSNGSKCWLGSCGCQHEKIEKHFPDLAKYIKWHMTASGGPMHYVENTIYHASDRDHNGHKAGEPDHFEERVYFGGFPIQIKVKKPLLKLIKLLFIDKDERTRQANADLLEIVEFKHTNKPGDNYDFQPNYSFRGLSDSWYNCPFDTAKQAEEFKATLRAFPVTIENVPISFSKGKERDFNAARSSSIWPEATDADLSQEPEELKKSLLARLPSLRTAFRRDMEELGFIY